MSTRRTDDIVEIQQLLARGASRQAVDALTARLALPVYGDVGGQAIIAADDGTTISFTSHEGPAHDPARCVVAGPADQAHLHCTEGDEVVVDREPRVAPAGRVVSDPELDEAERGGVGFHVGDPRPAG